MTLEALTPVLRDLFPSPSPVSADLTDLFSDSNDDEGNDFMEENNVTTKEVYDAIKGGKAGHTAPGLDGIPRRFLKHIPESMGMRVRDLFNMSAPGEVSGYLAESALGPAPKGERVKCSAEV